MRYTVILLLFILTSCHHRIQNSAYNSVFKDEVYDENVYILDTIELTGDLVAMRGNTGLHTDDLYADYFFFESGSRSNEKSNTFAEAIKNGGYVFWQGYLHPEKLSDSLKSTLKFHVDHFYNEMRSKLKDSILSHGDSKKIVLLENKKLNIIRFFLAAEAVNEGVIRYVDGERPIGYWKFFIPLP